ncbi:MAG: hypothetical protein ABR616_18775 [Dermatophilaceae bacterium]
MTMLEEPRMQLTNQNQFGRATWPGHQQMSLPGLGEGGLEQMRLFDTNRAGPANVYSMNPSRDAADWRDQDKQVPLNAEQQEIVDDEDYTVRGEFFEFPVGQDDREHMAYGGAHQETISDTKERGTYLGHEEYPAQPNVGLQFRDLQTGGDGYSQSEWWTPNSEDGRLGTEVGRIQFHEDDWGPNVDYAEINPLYQGRGFSRDALTEVAGGLEPGEGIMHAGSFTSAGSGAFQKKGIPTVDQIEGGYDDWVEGLEVDDDEVMDMARDQFPDEDWDGPDPPMSLADELRAEMNYDRQQDPDNRSMFREGLEEMQSQVLAKLPGRRGAFAQGGWKPERKFARNEELPGMPQKYAGGQDFDYTRGR